MNEQRYLLVAQIPNWGGGDEPQIPNDEIWYTSSDGNRVMPSATNVFGANIVSNNYSNGKGVIKFDGDVTSIRNNAFRGCTGLTSITIPNGVTSIISSAFEGCTGLTSIVVENGNKMYDSRNNCNAIIGTATNPLIRGCKTTIIPNSVTSIGDSAFSGCTGITSITIPNSVTRIGWYAFDGCTDLTSVTISNGVTSIGGAAFSGCTGLTSITIPNSVTSIGGAAFSGCTGITSVKVESTTPPGTNRNIFTGCTALKEIFVPSASVNAYKTASGWSDYANKIKGF